LSHYVYSGRNSGKASLNSTVPTSSQENVTLGTVVNKSRQSSQACKRLSKNPSRKRAKSLDLKSRNGKLLKKKILFTIVALIFQGRVVQEHKMQVLC
jgi:hypothetical protein